MNKQQILDHLDKYSKEQWEINKVSLKNIPDMAQNIDIGMTIIIEELKKIL